MARPQGGPIIQDRLWAFAFPAMIKTDNWLKKYIDLKMDLI